MATLRSASALEAGRLCVAFSLMRQKKDELAPDAAVADLRQRPIPWLHNYGLPKRRIRSRSCCGW
jgi:hypothetical protein